MDWALSGTWMDKNMPSIKDLDIPFFGYRTSPDVVLDVSCLDMSIFTAFVLQWEFVRPPTRTEFTNSWFMIHQSLEYPDRPGNVIDAEILGVEWTKEKLGIRSILRSGIADIYPTWVGLKSLTVCLADFLDIPDLQRIEENINFKTLTTQFELGYEQRRSKGLPLRNWTILLRKSSLYTGAVMEFFAEKHGQNTPFWWRNPVDGQKYCVRFSAPSLGRQVRWGIESGFQIGLTEVQEDGAI